MVEKKIQSTPEQTVEELPKPPRNDAVAKKWLWILVITFTAIILIFWGWATKISLSSFNWNKTPEKGLIDTGKTEWNNLFNNEADRIKQEQLKLQIKQAVNRIIAETTSSTTSTVNATTTINITTSSKTAPIITTSKQ